MANERWRRPARVIDVVPVEQELYLPDGRRQRGFAPVLDAESVERLRAGYLCAKCLEPFEQAWPERCLVCGAPVRSEQAAYFAREYAGKVNLGPSTTLADERERLPEEVAKEAERNGRQR